MSSIPPRLLAKLFAGASVFFALSVSAADEWTCTEVASQRDGNSVLVCGVATADNEGDAREQALIRARREFDLVCQGSADCRDFEVNIEPLRNACSQEHDGKYKCLRGLRYTILDRRKGGAGPAPAQQASFARPEPQPVKVDDGRAPFGVGASTYSLEAKQASAPGLTKSFTGSAYWLSYAVNRFFGMRGGLYSLENKAYAQQRKVPNFTVKGRDLQLLLSNNLDREGFRFYIGLGAFSETWEGSPGGAVDNGDHSGSALVLGLGYNWSHVTLEWALSMREKSEYGYSDLQQDASVNASGLMLSLRI